LKLDVKHVKNFIPVFIASFFLIALLVFWRETRGMTLAGLRQSLAGISRPRVFFALVAVALSYWLTTIVEKHAVCESGLKIPYRRIAWISFVSTAIGAVVGAAAVSGGSFRYRYYSECGARPAQVVRIVATTQLASWAGTAGLNGLTLLFWPRSIIDQIGFPSGVRWVLAFACLALPAFSLIVSRAAHKGKDFRIYGRSIAIPEPKIMFRQLAAGFFSPPATAMVLFFLLPPSRGINAVTFCGVFAIGSIIGAISMVPAGLGIFETTLLLMLRHFYSRSEFLSALLLYRLFFNLMPLTLAFCLLIFNTFRARHLKYRPRGQMRTDGK